MINTYIYFPTFYIKLTRSLPSCATIILFCVFSSHGKSLIERRKQRDRSTIITVEGPIGVGKTSLAKEISTHMQLHLLKEIVDENPFLGKFYEDIDEWSFQTEMFFLCNRYKQLEDINIKYLNQRKPVVADYHIFKNVIFASRTLKDSQYDKYMQIYRILTQDMPVPNVIVYLTASLETLQKRIAMRGREFEKIWIQITYYSSQKITKQQWMLLKRTIQISQY